MDIADRTDALSFYKRHMGAVSLTVCAVGAIVVEGFIFVGGWHGWGWRILAAAFEAGTVGALADWFAVDALFKKIPIPLLGRHTNIIVERRREMTDKIADMVQNKWLTPDIVRSRLESVKFVDLAHSYLENPENLDKTRRLLRDAIRNLLRGLESPDMAALIESIAKDQLATLDLAKPLGQWMLRALERGDNRQLWELLADGIARLVEDPETVRFVERLIKDAADDYAKRAGPLGSFVQRAGEWMHFIKYDEAARAVLEKASRAMKESCRREDHPLRQKFEALLKDWANRLAEGEPEAVKTVDELRNRLVAGANLKDLIGGWLGRLRATLDAQLQDGASPLCRLLDRELDTLLANLRQKQDWRDRVDGWLREKIIWLLEKHHDQIGAMVKDSLQKLSDDELVLQIREKVYGDLQYIRLNGAVVGSIVGALIASLRMLLSDGMGGNP